MTDEQRLQKVRDIERRFRRSEAAASLDIYFLLNEIQQLRIEKAETRIKYKIALNALEVARKLHETVNIFWLGDCDKADVIKIQSAFCNEFQRVKEVGK